MRLSCLTIYRKIFVNIKKAMKKILFKTYYLIMLIFFYSNNSYAIIFECENGLSYKMDKKQKQTKFYFKEINSNWQLVENVLETNNKLEYFLPNSTYLTCNDKKLNICRYKSLITYSLSTKDASVREVILDDCFIGTMGCNKYNKGLELNKRRCKIIY